MLQEYLQQLCKELAIKIPKLNEQNSYPFRLSDDVELELRDLNPGVSLYTNICLSPEKKKEDLFIYLMRANLLGQGTGGSRIGVDLDEKFLTLALGLPYEMNYQIFKESLKDFVNYLVYWRDEVIEFERENNVYS